MSIVLNGYVYVLWWNNQSMHSAILQPLENWRSVSRGSKFVVYTDEDPSAAIRHQICVYTTYKVSGDKWHLLIKNTLLAWQNIPNKVTAIRLLYCI